MAAIVLDDPRDVVLGSEPVRVNGRICGRVTSGGYGYSAGRSIAYAYLAAADAVPGTPVDIDLFGTWSCGKVAAEPIFVPKDDR
jgi:4-methylaminobutanoate oxidase (formaldehyde-forming)